MQVYRLEPKSATTTDQCWSTTRLKERCWVRARSETDARLKLTLVTGIAVPLRAGQRFPLEASSFPSRSAPAPRRRDRRFTLIA